MQGLVPQIPMLAPFFDKMVTEDIKSRFTARRAFEFLQGIDVSLTDEQRNGTFTRLGGIQWLTVGARWKGLPDDFVKKWSSYASPQPSLITRLLRKLCQTGYGHWIVGWARQILRV